MERKPWFHGCLQYVDLDSGKEDSNNLGYIGGWGWIFPWYLLVFFNGRVCRPSIHSV